MRQLEIDS